MIYTDQMMRTIRMDAPPARIVSLVPSITELLYDLGLENRIAGITKFCIHPEHIFRSKPRIGGTKQVSHEKIADLNPELIIANKEENTKEDIALLENKFTVWISDIKTLDDAYDLIARLGEITNSGTEATALNKSISREFETIQPLSNIPVLYLIWKNPYMAAGQSTFINNMIEKCGFTNILKKSERYPELDAEYIKALKPAVILLSSEPFPFKDKHISELKKLVPESIIELVDGEYFSWYGSRLKGSPRYFNQLINKLNFRISAAATYEN